MNTLMVVNIQVPVEYSVFGNKHFLLFFQKLNIKVKGMYNLVKDVCSKTIVHRNQTSILDGGNR